MKNKLKNDNNINNSFVTVKLNKIFKSNNCFKSFFVQKCNMINEVEIKQFLCWTKCRVFFQNNPIKFCCLSNIWLPISIRCNFCLFFKFLWGAEGRGDCLWLIQQFTLNCLWMHCPDLFGQPAAFGAPSPFC